jgi:hypothetical protein
VAAVAAAVPAVQEQVKQWAQQQQQKWQNAEDMGRVFGHNEKCRNGQEGDEHETSARSQPASGRRMVFASHTLLSSVSHVRWRAPTSRRRRMLWDLKRARH